MKISSQKAWFLGCTHFNHTNVLEYDNRPFDNITHHDEMIIKNWNDRVGPTDYAYLLGDFCFGRWQKAQDIYHRLNGQKFLIKGNHDKALSQFCKKAQIPLVGYMEIKIPEPDSPRKWQDIVLCHYPIAEWNKAHYGAIHCYSHTHGNSWYDKEFQFKKKCINVGAPCIDYAPISYQEIKEKLKKSEDLIHH